MKKWIENNFGLIIVGAVIIAFIFPPLTKYFRPFPEYALMVVLFLTFLKLDYSSFFELIKKPFPVIFFVVVNLFILPLAFFYGFTLLGLSSAALAFMLLAAAPAPASSAVLSDLCKGNPNYALSVTLISSIICPLSIPFLINILTPESVDIGFFDMFWKLFRIIIIPLVISIPFRIFAQKLIDKTKTYYSFANVFFLTIVLFGSIDGLQEKVFSEPEKLPFFMMIALIYFALKFVLSYLLGFWMRPDIKVSYSIVSTFINIGLIIVFAKEFFEDTMEGEVLLFIVLTQIIWNLGLFPLQKISLWFIKKTTW